MPVKAVPPPQVPAADWTGFYAGSHIGNAAVSNRWNSSSAGPNIQTPFAGSFTSGGNVGGVQFGYNYQIGRWVLGLETDVSAADIEGAARCSFAAYLCNTRSTRSEL